MKNKIRIAFIKFGGLTAGGSEKMLQIIAANLPKEDFNVDYFYCDPAPYKWIEYDSLKTDLSRIAFLEEGKVKLIKFSVQLKDISSPFHNWEGTDFWEKFDENNYDIIQTCRAGHKEYPFNKIKTKPIIDIIALDAGVDNQYNISKVMHLNNWSAERWVRKGGDVKRIEIVSLPIWVPKKEFGDFRQELSLQDKFIFGFHQRPDNNIFSSIPLEAYSQVENENTAFVLLGGGDNYRIQAKSLNLKNIYFLPPTGDQEVVYRFLNTLNVFAHGRKDGEVNSQAMAEALYFKLPIVSHYSEHNNGHVESIGKAGVVVKGLKEYVEELKKLLFDQVYYALKSEAAKKRFEEKYELGGQIRKFANIYRQTVKNPFPNKFIRFCFSIHYTQNIRIFLAWIYLQLKYMIGVDLLNIKKSMKEKFSVVKLLKRTSSYFQTPSSSFKQHNSQYEEEGKVEIERANIQNNEKANLFNSSEYKVLDLLNRYPEIRGVAVDIGSGVGQFSYQLSLIFKKVIAIEPSAKAIEISKTFYPLEKYKNIEWIIGFAENELAKLKFDYPAFFLTGVVLSHLRDKEVMAICAQVNRLALPGSLLCFNECWGQEWHQSMWHVRSKEWWQNQLPGWELYFHGPEIQNVPGRHKGIHGVKTK